MSDKITGNGSADIVDGLDGGNAVGAAMGRLKIGWGDRVISTLLIIFKLIFGLIFGLLMGRGAVGDLPINAILPAIFLGSSSLPTAT